MGREGCKILILFLGVWLAGCVKDKPQYTPPYISSGNVAIVCEGNLGNGDGTLYIYNTATDSVAGDLYKAANGQQPGDVFQSMTRIGDSLYLCVNNSDKIVVIDAHTYKLAGTISIPKPRYILPISKRKAYVSTLFSTKLYTIDPTDLQVLGATILPYQNPEGMCLVGGSLFVCPWDTMCNKILKIDAETGQIIQAIQVPGYAPHAVLVDKEQMLWVVSGNPVKRRAAAITRIDPSTGSVLKSYTLPVDADPIKPAFNTTRDTLYFIEVQYNGSAENNGIYRMGIHEATVPTTPFIKAAKYQYYWALGIEPSTGNIYVGDPKGFIQKGNVLVYNTAGTLLQTFNVGLGPGQFYFGN